MATIQNKQDYLISVYRKAMDTGLCSTQQEFANLLQVNRSTISSALHGSEKALTDRLINYVKNWASANGLEDYPTQSPVDSVPVIPMEAMAGTLGEFTTSIAEYDCERIISPIKGVDYAIKIHGDSMSPEYPSGSLALIKKVDERAFIEWGKVYVLDTVNGAVIKSVRKTDRENEVECVSLNPNYQPFRIDREYIFGWYRVLMVLAMK